MKKIKRFFIWVLMIAIVIVAFNFWNILSSLFDFKFGSIGNLFGSSDGKFLTGQSADIPPEEQSEVWHENAFVPEEEVVHVGIEVAPKAVDEEIKKLLPAGNQYIDVEPEVLAERLKADNSLKSLGFGSEKTENTLGEGVAKTGPNVRGDTSGPVADGVKEKSFGASGSSAAQKPVLTASSGKTQSSVGVSSVSKSMVTTSKNVSSKPSASVVEKGEVASKSAPKSSVGAKLEEKSEYNPEIEKQMKGLFIQGDVEGKSSKSSNKVGAIAENVAKDASLDDSDPELDWCCRLNAYRVKEVIPAHASGGQAKKSSKGKIVCYGGYVIYPQKGTNLSSFEKGCLLMVSGGMVYDEVKELYPDHISILSGIEVSLKK